MRSISMLLAVLIFVAVILAGAGVWIYVAQIMPKSVSIVVENNSKNQQNQSENERLQLEEAEKTQSKDQIEGNEEFITTKNKCSFFSDEPKSYDVEWINLPVNCQIDIGAEFLNWQFSIDADQEDPIMEIRDESNQLMQQIPIGDQYSAKGYNFLDDKMLADYVNLAYDINFDGYKDLMSMKVRGASNVYYDFWIFNLEAKKFERDPILTEIPNASFCPDEKVIEGYLFTGVDSGSGVKYIFLDGKYQIINEE